ncbi:hypothetical protein RJ639_013012 [Escallonia herrerae]|uniref:DC1 domain-containing protein n=1 Tax=Escallonia herrerae TaxID=1293975 RepID=A0AA88VPV7_9ASTE|nr:hypothetical protein RJ639_013012 [Escallonia herrerae]
MDLESKHFSHEHELILNEVQQLEDGKTKRAVFYGCLEPIAEQAFFSCGDCDDFFLHQTCANLSKDMEGLVHPQHPLILLANRSCICDVCGRDWKRFTYNCALCDFDVCIACALAKFTSLSRYAPHLVDTENRKARRFEKGLRRGIKNRLLALKLPTYAKVVERAEILEADYEEFQKEKEEQRHKRGRTETSDKNKGGGQNKKKLALQEGVRSTRRLSKICDTCDLDSWFMPSWTEIWLMTHITVTSSSLLKQFFAHIQCATSELKSISSERSEIKMGETSKVMKFPVPDEFMNQINYFLQELNIGEIQRATELAHVSHPHPLILCDVQAGNICISKDDLLVCNGCAQPIMASNSYYRCSQISCDFFLHTICTELPDEVQHPCHPEHPLSFHPKSSAESLSIFACNLCSTYSNGFRYRCELCNYDLDLRCASLPDTIEHEAHRHSLVPATSGIHCSACREYCSFVVYGCDTCGFYLDAFCAMFPRTATHYYDAHPLSLDYPPFPDHPDEFYCEMCQDEIAPNLWLYHCRDCNQSFHPDCLLPGHWWSNIKSGGTCVVAENIHEHPKLKLQKILQGDRISKWWCSLCDYDESAMVACTECDFLMCLRCLNKYPSADVHW